MLTTEIDRICDKFNSEIERLNLELDRLDIVAPSPESEKEYNAINDLSKEDDELFAKEVEKAKVLLIQLAGVMSI